MRSLNLFFLFVFSLFFSCEQIVKPYEVKLEELSIKKLPKVLYMEGEEVDWTGIEIEAVYTDGSSKLVEDEKIFSVSHGTTMQAGSYMIEVSTAGKVVVFPVFVAAKEAELKYPEYKDEESGFNDNEQDSDYSDLPPLPLFSEMYGMMIKSWFTVNLDTAFARKDVQDALKKQNVSTKDEFAEFIATVSDDFMKLFACGISEGGIDDKYVPENTTEEENIHLPPTERVFATLEDMIFIDNGDGTATLEYVYSSHTLSDGNKVPITDIEIPSTWNGLTVVKIGKYAVSDEWGMWDYDLLSVTMPDTITIVEYGAFKKCGNLQEVKLSQSLVELGDEAFMNCKNLKSIELPNTLEKLGYYCFRGTGITEITIPENVNEIDSSCFADTSITKIYINTNLEYSTYSALYGIKTEYEVIFGDNVSEVDGFGNFWEWELPPKIKRVSLPKNISILNQCFENCTGLEEVEFRDVDTNGCDSISLGHSAFKNCTSLKTFDKDAISRMSDIGAYAFENCTSLTIEDLTIPKKCKVSGGAFKNCPKLTGTLTILGAIGNFSVYYNTSEYAFAYCTGLKEVVIGSYKCDTEEGVTIEGNPEFIAIEGGVGISTFMNCTNLEKVTFYTPNAVEQNLFYNCKSLKVIDIPENWQIGQWGGIYFKRYEVATFSSIVALSNCPIEEIRVYTQDEYDYYTTSQINIPFRDKFVLITE